MNPSDCPSRDWSLYYSGTYMLHATIGVVQVTVQHGVFQCRKHQGGVYRQADPTELTSIWPVARSVNFNNQAFYVGRRPRQEARRSATLRHYVSLWSEYPQESVGHELLRALCFPPEYPSLEFAMRALQQEEVNSIAITRDLILARSPTSVADYRVVCQGMEAGTLHTVDNGFSFEGSLNQHPAGKRALVKLQKEGIVCH